MRRDNLFIFRRQRTKWNGLETIRISAIKSIQFILKKCDDVIIDATIFLLFVTSQTVEEETELVWNTELTRIPVFTSLMMIYINKTVKFQTHNMNRFSVDKRSTLVSHHTTRRAMPSLNRYTWIYTERGNKWTKNTLATICTIPELFNPGSNYFQQGLRDLHIN